MPREAWKDPVLLEPTVQEHFGFLRNYEEIPLKDFSKSKGVEVARVKNLDDATFQQLVRDGVPFVVDDCTRDFDADAVSNFQCKDFADRWPTGNMRAEYTPGQYHIYLKDPTWYSKVEPQRKHHEHMAGDTKIAGPYIWHVKDEEPLKTKREIQQHWRTPYFLKPSLANRMEANESFEFWFSMAGGGTFTHADAYCESTISMQFKGRKRWRIQAFPEIPHFFNASTFGDEQIYDNKMHVPWRPEAEFTVEPGQCFIFPTGYLHETFVDPADNEQGCFTASTFQFNHPRQVNLYRSYLSRFSMSHYGMVEPCLRKMSSYGTLLSTMNFQGSPDEQIARTEAAAIVSRADADKDEMLTKDELYKHFCVGKKNRQRIMEQGDFHYNWMGQLSSAQRKEAEEEAMQVWAEDAAQYHDLNKDKRVSVEELAYGLFHWNVVQHRSAFVQETIRSDAKATSKLKRIAKNEKDVLENFYCSDSKQCPEAEEMMKYTNQVLKAKKAKQVVTRLQGSFESGEEGDEEQLTMKDRSTGMEGTSKVAQLRQEL